MTTAAYNLAPDDLSYRAAVHETAHWLLDEHFFGRMKSIAIGEGGAGEYVSEDDGPRTTRHKLALALAGPLAECKYFGSTAIQKGRGDAGVATALIKNLRADGFTKPQADALVDEATAIVDCVLTAKRDEHVLRTRLLLQHKRLPTAAYGPPSEGQPYRATTRPSGHLPSTSGNRPHTLYRLGAR